jgi:hypothetical protein
MAFRLMFIQSSVASAMSSPSLPRTYLLKKHEKSENRRRSLITNSNPVLWYGFTLRTIVLTLLPLLSVIGGFKTWVLGSNNGTFKGITDLLMQNAPLLPGSESDIVRTYTGIAFVDFQLQILVTFFAPVVDSNNTDLKLFSIFGFGQFGAAWTLLMMESLRFGNKSKIISL